MNYARAIENLKSEIPHMDNHNLLNALHGEMYNINCSNYNFTKKEVDYIRERIRLLHNEVLDRMKKSP